MSAIAAARSAAAVSTGSVITGAWAADVVVAGALD
jgi:hypothetical protein